MSYQFKVGDKGRTRDGRERYEVLAVDYEFKKRPVIVKLIEGTHGAMLAQRNIDGTADANSDPQGIDLMPPTKTVYLNAYTNGVVTSYETEERARKAALNSNGVNWKIVIIAMPLEIPRS